jgi:hypothetical protein
MRTPNWNLDEKTKTVSFLDKNTEKATFIVFGFIMAGWLTFIIFMCWMLYRVVGWLTGL